MGIIALQGGEDVNSVTPEQLQKLERAALLVNHKLEHQNSPEGNRVVIRFAAKDAAVVVGMLLE